LRESDVLGETMAATSAYVTLQKVRNHQYSNPLRVENYALPY
jgi:hypothetical protein